MQELIIIVLACMCLYFLFEARKYERISFNLAEKYVKEKHARRELELIITDNIDTNN